MTKEQAETWLAHPVTQHLLEGILQTRLAVIEAQEEFSCLTNDAQTTHNNLLRCHTTVSAYDNVLEEIENIKTIAKQPEGEE